MIGRYIDADLLIKNIVNIEDLRTLSTKTIGEAISKTPAADVVEVVRCKECANGYRKNDISVMCKIWKYIMLTEDYCSYGGRADDE